MSQKNEKSASKPINQNANTRPGVSGGPDFTRGANSPSSDIESDASAQDAEIKTRHQERIGNRKNPNTTAEGETSTDV